MVLHGYGPFECASPNHLEMQKLSCIDYICTVLLSRVPYESVNMIFTVSKVAVGHLTVLTGFEYN